MLVELTDEDLCRRAPAIFAAHADPRVSDKYTFMSTMEVLPILRDAGFVATDVSCRRKVTEFGRHRIEFFHKDDLTKLKKGKIEDCPRVILENSHDRTRRLILMAGFYRLVCSNGLVVASGLHSELKARHLKLDTTGVKNLAHELVHMLDGASRQADMMRTRGLTKIEQSTFANYALEARYRGYESTPIEAKELLTIRRDADKANDLWTVFNRVQENVMHGGVKTKTGRLSRGVKSFHLDIDVNKRLWAGAEALMIGGTRALQVVRQTMNAKPE